MTIVGPAFDTADAVQLTWQNLVPVRRERGRCSSGRADIDTRIQVAGQQDQLETVLFMTLQPDTAGGQVRRNSTSRWTLPDPAQPAALALDGDRRSAPPGWTSPRTSISSSGCSTTGCATTGFGGRPAGVRPRHA